jgi:hypothetical protein
MPVEWNDIAARMAGSGIPIAHWWGSFTPYSGKENHMTRIMVAIALGLFSVTLIGCDDDDAELDIDTQAPIVAPR